MEDIGDYMSSTVLSVDSESTVQETVHYMHANNVGSVLIKEAGEYVGIVTETDLTHKVLGQGLSPDTTKVSEIMVQPIITLDCHLPITKANSFSNCALFLFLICFSI